MARLADSEKTIWELRSRVEIYRTALEQIAQPMPETDGDWGATYAWRKSAITRRDIARSALAAALNPAISPLCECGHSRENHRGADMSVGRAPCEATVYTEAPLGGGNAFTCHCRDYVPAKRPT